MIRKYAVVLGNLGNTRDRFCTGYKTNPTTIEMLKQAASIPLLSGVEFVGTWDLRPENVSEVRAAMADLHLECVSIIPDLFAERDFWKGSLCSIDPGVRQRAIDHVQWTCDTARRLSCPMINLWPGQDGYDYLLCADYDLERKLLSDAILQIAETNPDLRFSLEYKRKEPRTHSYIAGMADSLMLCHAIGRANIGVTIDTGHALMAGEVLGESIVLAKHAGNRLFHLHCNDNHTTTDDDMIAGSVHTIAFLEMFYWLDRCGYSGWFSMDQYPYRENGVRAIGESIQWMEFFAQRVEPVRQQITELIRLQDGTETSRFLRNLLTYSDRNS